MSEDVMRELALVARQIREQLKFYQEMGVTDLSAPGRPAASTPEPHDHDGTEARTVGTPGAGAAPPDPEVEPTMAKKKAPAEQAGLFGDPLPDTGEKEPARLPVLTATDPSLEAIREDIGDCVRCKLHEHRTHIVFGEGNPQAQLVFVGEGPGADEDATGRPFVGRAGQLLDKIIAAIGMKREEVYIANVVKCRPPGNRTPERDEVATCEQFLFRQLAFIRPQVIVLLGAPAMQCLLRSKEPISKARGQWREWHGIQVMPTFHPAFLLRAPEKKREAWEDMKKVRDYLNSAG